MTGNQPPNGVDHWRATCIERCPRGSVGSRTEKDLTFRHLAVRLTRYITNDRRMSAERVVAEARGRCNQENLHAQLKGAMRALHAPVNTLVANWAYMTMASLAWSIKAWCALLLPVNRRWADQHLKQRRPLLAMEFRTFRQAFIEIPCQIIRHARQVRWRIQAWNPWLGAFFRLHAAL